MKYNPEKHHRHSIRLKGYEYAQAGAYFVTIVAQGRACLFGEVADGTMRLGEYGQIVAGEWVRTADIRPNVTIDAFVVMPNHVHGIIVIDNSRGTLQRAPTTAEGAPTTAEGAPTTAEGAPTTAEGAPTTAEGAPTTAEGAPTTAEGAPTTAERAPTTAEGAPWIERFGKPTSNSIPTIVRLFKSASTKRINAARGTPGTPVWQRNYYEHIVRNEAALRRIREYILNNPLQWELDRENPARPGTGTIDSRMSEV